MSENLLGRETSPYLLQHKDNPVHWRPWGEAALAEARAADRPVLLSVGYAACHWCHVMAHESFEDPEIAALMNALFINIKVDREERPDIDAIYQQALAVMGQQGGWPLTMFLRPDGQPFWGGTYFPPRARWGRPGFMEVLQGVHALWRDDRPKVGQQVATIGDALRKLSQPQAAEGLDIAVIDQVAQRLVRQIDPFHGGFGDAPKFPNVPQYELLLRAWLRTGRQPYRTAVETTLQALAQGGIYDHLGGGWARYSTDERWLVPHFEKMLYDNAQLVRLFTLAWQAFGDGLYRRRVEETVDWLLREMIAANGAFASTLDADSEGAEGRFYVWSEAEVDAALAAFTADDRSLFKTVYDVSAHGNWEEANILNRLDHQADLEPDAEARLAAMRRALAVSRETRVRPGWDDKVLADWNGLMIAALAEAALAFDRDDWLAGAVRAYGAVIRDLHVDGRLRHSWRSGRVGNAATLEDHAAMVRAALALYEITGDDSYLADAGGILAIVDRHYWDAEAGGYFTTPDDGETLIVRRKDIHDNAVPSGNGMMTEVLARLYHLTGNDRYRDRAETLITAFSGEISRNLFPLATMLNGAELLERAEQIVIFADRSRMAPLLDVLRRQALPNRVFQVIAPDRTLPPSHPAAGKGPLEGRPTAYVCRGRTCSPPVADAAAFAQLLSVR